MSNRLSKNQKKTMGITIGAVAALLVVFAVLSAFTSGFTNFEVPVPTINPDNFYSNAELVIVDSNNGNGVRVDVDENTGALEFDGTAAVDLTYTVGTVVLNKGTYTLTASNKTSLAGIYVTAEHDDDVEYFDFTPSNTIDVVSDGTEYTIVVHIAKGTSLNHVDILPVISSGDEIVDFYE